MKVLIVDDNPADRKIVRYYFSSRGWETEEAVDGAEALRRINENPPNLIISDALMPNVDGFQFLRELKRSKYFNIPIVIYTATYKNEPEQDFARSLGADGYMIKPKDPFQFWEDLEAILAARKKGTPRAILTDDEEYLRKYSAVLMRKLGEKVRELEETKAAPTEPREQEIEESRQRMEERRKLDAELRQRLVQPPAGGGKPWKLLERPEEKGLFFAPLKDMERHNVFLIERDGSKLPADAMQQLRQIQSSIRVMTQLLEELLKLPSMPRMKLHAPLRRIEALVQVLDEDHGGLLDSDGRAALDGMIAARERMVLMIDDVLELMRIQQVEVEKGEVDLSATAQDIVRDLKATDPKRKTTFVIQEGVLVRGDRHLLRVVLENLFENSWKFTSRTAVSRIEFGTEQLDGQTVYFVRDNGVGFDPGSAARLFSPFNRLHADSDFPGTGIGLAILHNIVERHGGRCWANGMPGEGASFYFTLGD